MVFRDEIQNRQVTRIHKPGIHLPGKVLIVVCILCWLSLEMMLKPVSAQVSPARFSSTGDSLYHYADSLYQVRKNDQSNRLFEKAGNWYFQQEEWTLYLDCLVKRANLMIRERQFEIALRLIETADEILEKEITDRKIIANFYNTSGSCNYRMGRYNTAIDDLESSVHIYRELGVENLELAIAYNNLGGSYYSLGHLTLAHKYIQYSLDLKERILSPEDNSLALSYQNVGVMTYMLLGRYEEGMEYLQKAAEIWENNYGKDHFYVGAAYSNIGIIYNRKADYHRALDYQLSALRIYENQEGEFSEEIGKIYNNIGINYLQMSEFEQSLEWFFRSLENKTISSPLELSTTYNNIAQAYKGLDDSPRADEYFNYAIDYTIQFFGEGIINLSPFYLNYGSFCIDVLKDREKGIGYYRKALELNMDVYGLKHPSTSKAYYNIGLFYGQQNLPDSALYYIQRSIIGLVKEFKNPDYRVNPELKNVFSHNQLLNCFKEKGELLEKLFNSRNNIEDLKFGLSTLELAVQLIEEIRISFQLEESRLVLAQREKNTYHQIIRLAIRLFEITGDPEYKEKAFEYTEKSKSAILLAAIRNFEAQEFGGIPEDLLQTELDTKQELSIYKEMLYEEQVKPDPDTAKITLWEGYIFNLNNKMDSLVTYFEENYPDYYTLKFNTSVVHRSELVRSLDRNKAILEYVVSDTILYTFFHSHDQFLVQSTPIDTLFCFNTRIIRDILVNRNFSNGVAMDYTLFIHASNCLYNKLIKPFEPFITGKELVIVPDQELAYIPFEILLSELPEFSRPDYRNLPYLIRTYPISYSYSSTLLMDKSRKTGKSGKNLLAFAPSYTYTADSVNLGWLSRGQYRADLYPIPGVKDEVTSIQRLMGGDIYLDEEATESNFKNNSSTYDILHLAMHTILDDMDPMYSKLVFTNVPGDDEDGLLNTFEVYNLKLNARMAVLSSCNSGMGKLQQGEGVMSLARGFIYAGCPGIIMTLWEVEDNSGAKIMSRFYHYLKKGYSKDNSLRQAKLDFLKDASMVNGHPYFWSAYVNIGDPDPLFHRTIRRLLVPGLAILLLFIGIGFFWYRKKSAGS